MDTLNRLHSGANKESAKVDHSSGVQRSSDTLASRGNRLVTMQFTWPDAVSNNDTVIAALCSSQADGYMAIEVESFSNRYLLPDCFFLHSRSLTSLKLNNFILTANSTYADPLQRLGASTSLTKLSFTNGVLLSATNGSVTVNWNEVTTSLSSLTDIDLSNTNLGVGATLPSRLNVKWQSTKLENCGLSGAIPSTLLDDIGALASVPLVWSLDLSHNALTDDLPSLFANWNLATKTPTNLVLDLSFNALSGQFPTGFTPNNIASSLFQLDISNNQFSGPASNILADAHSLPNAILFIINASSNTFTGSVLPSFTLGSSLLPFFSLDLSNNGMSGALPTAYFSSLGFVASPSLVALNLAGNKFDGNIPPTFLTLPTIASSLLSAQFWSISLAHNLLTGSLPPAIFSGLNWTSTFTASFNFASNQLTGGFPTYLITGDINWELVDVLISVQNNPTMTGTIPSDFLASLFPGPDTASEDAPVLNIALGVSSTGLTGALDLGNMFGRVQPLNIQFLGLNANFTTVALGGSAGAITRFEVTNNYHLFGTIPSDFFGPKSILQTFLAGNTLLTGDMPDMGVQTGTANLTQLILTNTAIQFCSGTRTAWSSATLTTCDLAVTTAFYCADKYPSSCLVSTPPPSLQPPIGPVLTIPPITAPTSPPIGCSNSTRPSTSSDWKCVGSTWTFTGTIVVPTFTIPAGAVETVVKGNVSSSEIIISGVGSTLVISDGCATNLTSVTITLTKADLDKIGSNKNQTLLSFDSSCETDLNNVTLTLKVTQSSCKKAGVKKASNSNVLSALFTIDQSGCRTWWIVLAAVLASVAVIAIVVIVLLVLFVRPVREFFRLHSRRKRTAAAPVN